MAVTTQKTLNCDVLTIGENEAVDILARLDAEQIREAIVFFKIAELFSCSPKELIATLSGRKKNQQRALAYYNSHKEEMNRRHAEKKREAKKQGASNN